MLWVTLWKTLCITSGDNSLTCWAGAGVAVASRPAGSRGRTQM